MQRLNEIIEQIKKLVEEGERLQINYWNENEFAKHAFCYESWYTKSLAVITALSPERLSDFILAYKTERRKEITYENYTISDYFMGLVVKWGGKPSFNTKQAYQAKLLKQLAIINAIGEVAPQAIYNIQTMLRADLFDRDLETSREMLKFGHMRSAGVICGVVLETHLKSLIAKYKIPTKKKELSISDCNDLLKEGKIYDVPLWRLVQRLADIRNLCAHAKDREPTQDEVNDLIIGTDKVIKEFS